jgi:predicted nucleic acid-binding protein
MVIESAPVMGDVWKLAAARTFAVRRIIDARLALTLIHHGVREFATTNVRDFRRLGFDRVWNPIQA